MTGKVLAIEILLGSSLYLVAGSYKALSSPISSPGALFATYSNSPTLTTHFDLPLPPTESKVTDLPPFFLSGVSYGRSRAEKMLPGAEMPSSSWAQGEVRTERRLIECLRPQILWLGRGGSLI